MAEATVVDLRWEGPLKLEEVEQLHGPTDYGIYQVYGTHNGTPDQLKYIGCARDNKFGARVPHIRREWADFEPKPVEIYLGRLGSVQPISVTNRPQTQWGEWIRRVEAMLIYYTAPPFNSSGLNEPKLADDPTVILNVERRHRLPAVISNLYEVSPVFDDSQKWLPFSDDKLDKRDE